MRAWRRKLEISDHLADRHAHAASRLIVGTGKYASYELMAEALELSGTDCITVAVRRERLIDAEGQNILDYHRHPPLHAAAEHGRLLHGRRRRPRGPAGPRDSAGPGKPRRRLGQAGSAGRHQNAAARSRGHAGRHREARGRRLSGPVLHQRRSDHRPAAQSRPAPSASCRPAARSARARES